MFFNPCHFPADFFCKCTFCCFPVHIAKESGDIRIDGVTFPFGIQENLRRQISQLQSFFLDTSMPDGRRYYLRAGLRYQTAVSQVTCS